MRRAGGAGVENYCWGAEAGRGRWRAAGRLDDGDVMVLGRHGAQEKCAQGETRRARRGLVGVGAA